MAQDYNETLNLPQTNYPMRGNLPAREPKWLEQWESDRLYYELQKKNEGLPKYILHDGPPYANGNIHMGTALNKVLKDIIVKYKSMTGYQAPFVPGWDCHGLPIELKALKQIGSDGSAIDPVELRKCCREFALSCLDDQKAQFKRLGVWGDFDDPYLTIRPEFEAKQVEVFGKMAERGLMYKGLKPVYWCPDCNTALAEAEIEYEDDVCYSIYVKFPISDSKGKFDDLGIDLSKAYVVIWTTTTWTLPGNVAVCLGPNYEYTFVKVEDEESSSFGDYLLMATDLVSTVMEAAGIKKYSTVGTFLGSDLEFVESDHPFMGRKSTLILGDHVTLESGTGCVHTAPGYGLEDFEVCNKYKGMFDIIVGVTDRGVLNELSGQFAGIPTGEAHPVIAKKLEDDNLLLAMQKIVHPYPHCWRCHKPIIYRATEQWFCSVEKFADEAVKAIEEVTWIPGWGEERIKNMVRDRSDWCISRQRRWGVPIPVLYCKDCGKPIVNSDTIKAISDLFRAESSDAWYSKDPSEFIPSTIKCDCGCGEFTKEMDIFDVWFDSGVTWAAVMDERDYLSSPADLYLEGCDQYRGWFQSSLLTSVAATGHAPYKAVCTHGWIVDGKGEKMSKSKGNYIVPEQVIEKYGADVLRLWVTSLDYHSDVRVSDDILKQLSETYRKIRNTARYILGNLCNGKGFNPNTDMVALDSLEEIDKWALTKYDTLIEKVKKAYEDMDYYHAYHAINSFCVVDMSNFYLDILKDRLYCEKEDGQSRRAAQTAMYIILSGLTRLIAPILSFTADEIWQELPAKDGDDKRNVVFNRMPEPTGISVDTAKWDKIHAIRDDVLVALEKKRNEKVIGKSLEAKVVLYTKDDLSDILPELDKAFIVSQVELGEGEGEFSGSVEGLTVTVEKATGEKCARCWTYSDTVGKNEKHPELCCRCASVVE
ncbi:MAG: isoleucine--tRNA ligase [Ruminiclostridium sp.]|nr:isoleucine--tRNA ligase [Ruminiclostridium sp.]